MSNRNLILAAAGQVGGEYQISRSLRFNSADSAYLSRTPASASNRKTWTWSAWVKRSSLSDSGGGQALFAAYNDSTNRDVFRFKDLKLEFQFTNLITLTATPLYRDVSAWYHIVLALDTTQATSANRVKIYVNGEQITAFDAANYPSQNADGQINNNVIQYVGARSSSGTAETFFDGYLTEVNFIDGQALTPSSFGETDAVTGVWKPIRYAGTYGTNGFHLDFSDNTSTTTLGYDAAGSNDWTLNNFSVTAGVGNDSLVDTPTPYGTDTGAGGEVRGNYATLNPLRSRNSPTFSQGNMRLTGTTGSHKSTIITIPPVSGDKIYGEATVANNTSGSTPIGFGFTDVASGAALPDPSDANLYIFYGNANGNIYNGTSLVTSGLGAPTAGTVIQVAYDKSNGYAWVGKANTWYDSSGGTTGNPSSGTNPTFTLTSNNLNFYLSAYDNSLDINFGQRPFAHTAPSGFKALVTTNLPEPTVVQGDDYFNTVLYTGTGSSLGVTGVGFQPDFVWIKERSGAADHGLYDAVRGVQNQLESNTTTAETTEATGLTAFGTDGFTVGALAQLNTNTDTYVAWNWKANGAGSSNTDGTITSTVSANTTAGISIVTYTGTGANATVGHGIGIAPSMVIVKRRDTTGNWIVWNKVIFAASSTNVLFLDTTDAQYSAGDNFNSTAPTSTVFSIGTNPATNASSSTYVAYCFAEVEGFSKFGSYTGNDNADGPFVYTGFRPAFLLIKNADATQPWVIIDATRSPYNVSANKLYPNASDAEESTATNNSLDILSNGFKLRGDAATNDATNGSSNTIIFAAFASNPFKYSLAR